MSQIHGECGYEIHREGGQTLLVNRGTWGIAYGMGILGMVASIAAVVGLLGLVGVSDVQKDLPASILLGLAAACAVIAGLMFPAYRRKRGLSPTEVPGTGIMDHGAGVLRGSGHDVLARLESVRVAVRIDWWTRGWMRLVVLTWPGGRRTVFRTWSRQRARIVAESLRDLLSA